MDQAKMWAVLSLVAVGLMCARADALVVTTAQGNGADTYINGEGATYHAGDTNYGAGSTFVCRRSGGDYTRKGYVRLDLGGIRASDVTFNVTVNSTVNQSGGDTTMNVWAVNDGYPGVDNSSPANGTVTDDEDTHDEFWAERDPNGIDWFSAPGNLGDTTMDPTSSTLLGSFIVPMNAPQYTVCSFNDPNLTALVNNDSNGVITLVMQPDTGTDYVYFLTKEGTTTTARRPQIVLTDEALTWDGGAGADKNWINTANWDADGLPNVSATFNDAATAAAGTVTNIVDRNFTLGSLTYQSTANAHTTQIDAGCTLLLNGLGTGRALVVGNVPSADADSTAVITGGGSLVVNTPSEDILVTSGSINSPLSESVLDMSGLANFQATINEFRIATEHMRTQAQVTLAQTNTITADAIIVASSTYTGTLDSFLHLGQTNTLNTNKIIVAGARSTSKLEFDPTLTGAPSVTIRGKAGGTSRTAMWVADQAGQGGYGSGGSSIAVGTADFTGGSLDAMFSTLTVGRNGTVASQQPGGAIGTFSFDAGTLDATTIYVSLSPLLPNTNLANFDLPDEGHARGTLNMGGGTLLAGSMTLGRVEGSDATATSQKPRCTRATGTFNLSGGNATVTGNLVLGHHTSDGPLEATGIINMTGGSLAVGGNLVEGTGGAISVSAVNVLGGALTVAGDLKVDSLRVGVNHASGTASVGGDVVIGASGNLDIGVRDDGVSGPVVVGTLDLTNADSVTLDLDNLNLGVNNRAKARGNLLLSTATNAVTATTITLGDSTSAYQDQPGDESRIELNGATTIAADAIRVGMLRSRGIIEFGTGGGTLTLGSAGDPIAQLRLGYNGGGTSSFAYGVLDLSGGTVDAYVDQVVLGNHGGPYTTGTGGGTGILSIAAGTFRANSIILGNATASGYGPGNATGTINFSGGTLVAGSIAQGSTIGNSTANFNWTGGTLHVGQFGSATQPLDLLNTGDGTLAPGSTTQLFGNYAQSPNATFEVDLDSTTAFDVLGVTGGVQLDGALTVNLNHAPEWVTPYRILDNDGTDPINGIFAGLDEGTFIFPEFGGTQYNMWITYIGGTGNDVELIYAPEPATMALLALGVAPLALRRRKRAGKH